jgi:HEAT repeat protein
MAGWKTVVWQSLLTVAVVAGIVAYFKREADAQREWSDRTAVEKSIGILEEAVANGVAPNHYGPEHYTAKDLQLDAVRELKRRGPAAASAVPLLIRSLKSTHPYIPDAPHIPGQVRDNMPAAAREALVSIGKAAVPDLKVALHDDDALTRVHAARALWELEGNADEVFPVMRDAWLDERVYHQDANVRMEAGKGLEKLLEDPNEGVRQKAKEVLDRLQQK